MPQSDTIKVRKHFRLNQSKLTLAQTLLGAATETETIERALDLVIAEYERNLIAEEAHQEFMMSGIEIRDVFGSLEQ